MRKPSTERYYVVVIRSIVVGCCYHFCSESIAIGLFALWVFEDIDELKSKLNAV